MQSRRPEKNPVHILPRGCIAWFEIAVCMALCQTGLLCEAHAQNAGTTLLAQGLLSPPLPPDNPYARFDPLRWKGMNIPLPGPADSLDQDPLGLRSDLADAGIGYFGFTNSYFEDNVLNHGIPGPGSNSARQQQLYNGQLPTLYSSNVAILTYDLSRFGIPNGQFVIGGTFLRTNWNPAGPSGTILSQLSYYQTLFNGTVELKAGYLSNSLEFFGTYVGGNIAGGVFGPSAGLPVEQGESSTIYSTPGVNVTIHLDPRIYTKVAVERAISPDGVTVEQAQNPSGVRFTVPNAGPLFIDEVGYRTTPGLGHYQTWIRAAATYSGSRYDDFDKLGQRSTGNYGLFLLVDRQLIQFHRSGDTGAQGIYAGFSVEYVPPTLNRFSQYYEARLYSFGPIPGRPKDQASFVFTDNVFSDNLVRQARAAGELAHADSLAFTASYSAHVYHGVNLNLGLSYVNNPTSVTYTGNTGSALNLIFGTVTFF